MLAHIEEVHNAHGLSFKLVFDQEPEHPESKSLKNLRELLEPMASGALKNATTLYVHKIDFVDGEISVQLVEASKDSVRSDNRVNSAREDGKFIALIIEAEAEAVPGGPFE